MEARALVQSLVGERARFVGLARRRVRSDADAEDVVQRALLRAAERAASLEDPARARAWFYRILRNAIADQLRGAPPDAAGGEERDLDAFAAEAPEEARTACACAPRLMAELPASYAEVLRRVDVLGEDPKAVAAALGISLNNLEVRLHRARRRLQGEVKAHCGVTSHRPCLDCGCGQGTRCGGPPNASLLGPPTR